MKTLLSLFTGRTAIDDLLSPILVKELRQGMRARVFIVGFLLLQLCLGTLVLANVAAMGDRVSLDQEERFFWIIVGFALIILMPFRALVAISLEVRNRTMETVMLTHLTAWRVVFGKWSALFAQSLLFVSAILPYVVLRYFVGGNDVVQDLELILVLLWGSGMLIAAGIAVSALTNVIVRIFILIAIVVVTIIAVNMLSAPVMYWGTWWEVLGWLAIFGFFVPALLLELTASSLAPEAENHAIRRRVLATLFFLAACGMSQVSKSAYGAMGYGQPLALVALMVLFAICYYELSEKARIIPRLVRRMSRWGALGPFAALFFLPGWPAGLVFSLVAIPVGFWLGLNVSISPAPTWPYPYHEIIFIYAVFGSVLPPILICHLLWPKVNQVLLIVVLYNLIMLGVVSVAQGFAALTHTVINPFLSFFPSLPTLSSVAAADPPWLPDHSEWFIFGNTCFLAPICAILIVAAVHYFRRVFQIYGKRAETGVAATAKSDKW